MGVLIAYNNIKIRRKEVKSKQKIAIITIISVMVLVIIGLAVGIVLVASQANLNNTMTVSYTANNVDCIVTASGQLHSSDKIEDISIINGTSETEHKIEFKASDSGTNGVATKSGAEFDKVILDATDKAVYKFNILNTATPNESNTRQLQIKAEAKGVNKQSNVKVSMGATIAEAQSYKGVHFASIAANTTSQNSTDFFVVLEVNDATIDIDNYKMELIILISYDIYDEDYIQLNLATAAEWQHNEIALSTWDGSFVDGDSHVFAVYTDNPLAGYGNLDFVTLSDFELTGNETIDDRVAKIDRTVLIQSAADLIALADYINHSEYTESNVAFRTNDQGANNIVRTTFVLGCDIDLGGYKFEPIGSGYGWTGNYRCFSGYFTTTSAGFGCEGEKTIYNLNIQEVGTGVGNKNGEAEGNYSAGIGLFGYVRCGVIENININSATVEGGYYVGSVVGYLHNTISHYQYKDSYSTGWITFELAEVKNCDVVNVNVYSDQNSVGGVCGYASISKVSNCSITDSYVFLDSTFSNTGAIVGHGTFSYGKIEGSTTANFLKDKSSEADTSKWGPWHYLLDNIASNVVVMPQGDMSSAFHANQDWAYSDDGIQLYSETIQSAMYEYYWYMVEIDTSS